VGHESHPPLCLGTAGHVDHGKTWLVKALTGKDTDRLPEERSRGISIDLGYAPLELPGGRRLSVVDVPGHEHFVRTMIAGATGIDLFLLVIDAAEGARPQTLEHLAVLDLLGVSKGVIAVSKSDRVDAETLELALAEARDLVPGAPAVAVSGKTGYGLEELRSALAATASRIERRTRPAAAATRLFIDRAFTLSGVGTVATGTLWSGAIRAGDELLAEPGGREVRVRTVQVHDRPVSTAEAGQRVAVSLPGVDAALLKRGLALVEAGAFRTSYRLDVLLRELEPIPDALRVRVHHGTAEIPARVVRAGERFAQLRLSSPVVAARGDRVVLRTQATLGGGEVLDPAPPRHSDAARFELLERRDIAALVQAPVPLSDMRHLVDGEPEGLVRAGAWVFSRAWLDELRADVRQRFARAAPLDPGIEPPAEAWASAVVPLLGLERRGAKLYLPGATASAGDRAEEAAQLENAVSAAGPAGHRIHDRELAAHLERAGRIIRLGDGFAVGTGAHEDARRALFDELERVGTITLGRFRDLLGISRRPAQLLLERFDADGITRRVGDARVLRRAARRRG
jgi:selenocysteine-specific elongation factor